MRYKIFLLSATLILLNSSIIATAFEYKRIDTVPLKTLFAYDKNLPFNVEKKVLRETATTITYSIYYDSSHEERVPAVLTVPKRKGPHPVIIFCHGYGMKKDLGPMADTIIGQKGFAIFGIDTKYRNEREREGRDILSPYIYTSRDAFIQTVVDNMRGIDYLETLPEIDTSRIGIMGLSMGSYIGTILFSLDHRIQTATFGVGGADWTKVSEKSMFGPFYQLRQSGRSVDELLNAFATVDPINYVWDTKGRPVLMVNGRLDELVPPEAAKALFKGLAEPKHIIWFDGGHVPSIATIMNLVNEMLEWFKKYLNPEKYQIVAEKENVPPTISDLKILSTGEIRQNEKISLSVRADDVNKNIIFVKAFFDCGDDEVLLYDDGKSGGDTVKGDGIYTGRHTMYEKAALGKSLIHVTAVDGWGAVSSELTAEIDVKPIQYPAGAHPPAITDVIAPESAHIGDKIHFEIHAQDPDKDLDQILISIIEIGLTLSMPPDSSGAVIQDFSLPDMVPPGTYHIKAQAKDKTKMYSEAVEKTLEVLPSEKK